jgi:polysaccharide biosynthesis protein PelF
VTSLPRLPAGQGADVGFLLEGTYPYVSGGVSTWVHDIICGLPELTFGVVFIGSAPEDYGPIRYELPPNLVHLEAHYLAGFAPRRAGRSRGKAVEFEDMADLHERLRQRSGELPEVLRAVAASIESPGGIDWNDFLSNDQAWREICASYQRFCTSPSFVDYFWTVRTMHQPLFQMAALAGRLPPFRLLHSVSTGYAGFLGSILEQQRGCPYVLTEHGIYTKERKIDLAHADWIRDVREELAPGLDEDRTYVRRLWVRFFEGIGRMAYASARPIVSLFEGNRQRQIADGAATDRTQVIPNGVDVGRFAPRPRRPGTAVPRVLGFIGRVVPIKDIRGFIRAMRTVVASEPDAEGWIIGPEDESPDYARECRQLVVSLGLEGRVKFLGFRKPEEVFPQLGVLVLTSISEGLPLVVLESFASGVPVVATDVGSCRELIEGRTREDRALGPAGAVVPIAAPEATAAAALALLRDPDQWWRCSEAGLRRVREYFTQEQMFDSYRSIYRGALEVALGRDRLRAS